MKKTKKRIKERLTDEIKLKAKTIRLNPDYERDIEYLKSKGCVGKAWITEKGRSFLLRRHDDGYYPYSPDVLKKLEEGLRPNTSIADDSDLFSDVCDKMVNIVLPPGSKFTDEEGFIHFRLNPKSPREIIHFLIDRWLDVFSRNCSSNYNNRFRKEQLAALTVWDERSRRKSFKQIAAKFNITESTAKKRFYKAYEIIYGKKYNSASYEKPTIKKEYLKRECSTCKESSTCKELCPDVIAFVDQDNKKHNRETTTTSEKLESLAGPKTGRKKVIRYSNQNPI